MFEQSFFPSGPEATRVCHSACLFVCVWPRLAWDLNGSTWNTGTLFMVQTGRRAAPLQFSTVLKKEADISFEILFGIRCMFYYSNDKLH